MIVAFQLIRESFRNFVNLLIKPTKRRKEKRWERAKRETPVI